MRPPHYRPQPHPGAAGNSGTNVDTDVDIDTVRHCLLADGYTESAQGPAVVFTAADDCKRYIVLGQRMTVETRLLPGWPWGQVSEQQLGSTTRHERRAKGKRQGLLFE